MPNGVPANLVPFITQPAIGKRGPITVFGNDYNTPDGSAIRDYVHVAAIKRLDDVKVASNYEVFNIGMGRGSSVFEVISAFENVTEEKLQYNIGKRREGDVEQVYGDVTKSLKPLNWKAELGLKGVMRSA